MKIVEKIKDFIWNKLPYSYSSICAVIFNILLIYYVIWAKLFVSDPKNYEHFAIVYYFFFLFAANLILLALSGIMLLIEKILGFEIKNKALRKNKAYKIIISMFYFFFIFFILYCYILCIII